MHWKIWYGDGSTFSSSEGSWDEAPADNVQCIAVSKIGSTSKPHNFVIRGKDFYGFDGEKFYWTNNLSELPNCKVKFGRWVSDKEIVDIITRAKSEFTRLE